jgi:branched-chain amino acid transport system permease protein
MIESDRLSSLDLASASLVMKLLPAIAGVGLLVIGPILQLAYVYLLTEILILGLFAISYDFLFGYAGLMSFGHAAFFGVGAYSTVHLSNEYGLQFYQLLVIVIAIALLLGFIMGWISLHASGVYFAMVTLAIAQLLYLIVVRVDFFGGSEGFSMVGQPETLLPIDLGDPRLFYLVAVVAFVGSYLLLRRILRSPVGEILQAIHENEQRTQMVGYNVFRYKLAAFVTAGVFAGVSGLLYGMFLYFVTPSFLHWSTTGDALIQVMIGGMGTLVGGVVGVAFFLVTESVLSPVTDRWYLIVGILFIAVVLYFPQGIVGTIQEKIEDRE